MAMQEEMGAATPRTSLWMTGMRENIEELPDLLRLAAKMGVPEVYLQRMVYYHEAETAPGLMDAGHGLFDDFDMQDGLFDDFDMQVERLIVECEVLAQELGLHFKAAGATNPHASLEASKQRDRKPWKACMRPWTTAYITLDDRLHHCQWQRAPLLHLSIRHPGL